MDYGPWGGKESDTTEQLTHTHIHTHIYMYNSMCMFTHREVEIFKEH